MTIIKANPGWWVVNQQTDKPTKAYWSPIIAWNIGKDGYGLKAIATPDPYGVCVPSIPSKSCRFIYDSIHRDEGVFSWPSSCDEGVFSWPSSYKKQE